MRWIMAQTYQCVLLGEGGRVDHTPGADVAAGDIVVTNGMLQFATQPIASGVLGTLRTAGGPPLVRAVKANGAISVGNAVYWDDDGNPQGGTAGTGCATTTATANTFMGRAVAAAGANDETVDLEMSIGVVTNGGLENAITDPGASGAIPVTASGHVAIVTTGVQTRTLAAPSYPGQQMLLYMKTDGGNCTITCATTINETGNNTITFANTGEAVLLIAVEEGSNYRWRLATADGASLSTV
jgi:predicted RecA/RadA family phage recombinase